MQLNKPRRQSPLSLYVGTQPGAVQRHGEYADLDAYCCGLVEKSGAQVGGLTGFS